MAFGDFARLDDYDPDAGFADTFASRFGAAPLSAEEAAALRQRQFTNRQQGEGAPRGEAVVGALGDILKPIVETPGRTMQQNPYPPGSEEASAFEDYRNKNATEWARDRATDMLGTGLVGKPGAATLGSGAVLKGKIGGPWEGGIRAYHSSPHDFEKVDFSKLRTGEGANVYGAGHYMAENPAVSGQGGQYWDQFTTRFDSAEQKAASLLSQTGFDREQALRFAQREAELAREMPLTRMFTEEARRSHIAQMDKTVQMLEGNAPVGPRTYEMNLRAKPEELLDWDKGLQAQSPYVLNALRNVDSNLVRRWVMEPQPYATARGENIYEQLAGKHDPVGASQQLRDAGIPGIRYLDEGSRAVRPDIHQIETAIASLQERMQTGRLSPGMEQVHRGNLARWQRELEDAKAMPPRTYNYVGTDPSRLDILAKYGIAGGLPLGALAAQDNYQQ